MLIKTVLPILLWPLFASAGTIVLEPMKDTTLYEDVAGPLGNGAGDFLFVGRTRQPPPIGTTGSQGQLRRTLLQFAVENAIPAGAIVVSAKLELTVSKVPSLMPATQVSIHRLLDEWGEGTSNASAGEGAGIFPSAMDATWSERFFNETPAREWVAQGGDFVPAASALATVTGQDIRYSWESLSLTQDVSQWISGAVPNHGWMVIGDESVILTAKRFNSRENPNVATRPNLTLSYLFPTEVTGSLPMSNGSVAVSFTTALGQNYTIESSTTLSEWDTMPPVAGDGSEITAIVPAPAGERRLFIRIKTSD